MRVAKVTWQIYLIKQKLLGGISPYEFVKCPKCGARFSICDGKVWYNKEPIEDCPHCSSFGTNLGELLHKKKSD